MEGYNRYFTNIAHAYFDYVITVASASACFSRQWPKLLIQSVSNWELGFKLVGDGDLEILLDNAEDANTSKLINGPTLSLTF